MTPTLLRAALGAWRGPREVDTLKPRPDAAAVVRLKMRWAAALRRKERAA